MTQHDYILSLMLAIQRAHASGFTHFSHALSDLLRSELQLTTT